MRKSLSILLVLLILLTCFMGCSKSKESPQLGEEVKKATDDGSQKFTLEVMTTSFQGGGWPEDHAVIKKLNDKLNIDLKMQWVPNDTYDEKMNVLAASNSFPDVYRVQEGQFNKWWNKGIFLDVKPYLKDYSNLTKYLDEDAYKQLNPKGKYYGFPFYVTDTRDSLAIRKDWLDKLKLKVPTTLDEFYDVAKEFAHKDPDGNKKDDTIGFSCSINNAFAFSDIEFLQGAFGLANGWKDINGQLVPYQVQSKELKSMVAFLQKAYAEGVLDKDFMVNKGRDPLNKLEAGKSGIGYVNPNQLELTTMATLSKVHPDAVLIQLTPPKGPKGLQATKTLPGLNKIVINTKIDPQKQQRAMKLLDYMLSDEGYSLIKNGIEGIHYRKVNENKYEKLEAFDKERPYILSTWFFRRFDVGIQFRLWDDQEATGKIVSWFKENAKYRWKNDGLGLVSSTQITEGKNLQQKWVEIIANIIVGREPIDAVDKAVKEWKENGGDTIIKEMNDEYNKLK